MLSWPAALVSFVFGGHARLAGSSACATWPAGLPHHMVDRLDLQTTISLALPALASSWKHLPRVDHSSPLTACLAHCSMSGDSLTVREGGRAAQAAFRAEVLDPALGKLVELPEWQMWKASITKGYAFPQEDMKVGGC